jgi:tetratricopeptide (TPR) repeat protein
VWNALGIGYLQMPDYDRAISAFRDAIRRAPFWAYPRHNLALALRERGNLRAAIEQYLAAIQLAPKYSYLRYNLGLLYQQINDRVNADIRYKEAFDKAPGDAARARVLIAQATLAAAREHSAAALGLLDEAARHGPDRQDLLALRHNRALILARDDSRHAEAESLWAANLRDDPDYLPSMLALAEALDEWKVPDRAASWYREIVSRRPEYVAARLRLAKLLSADQALQVIEEGIARDPKQPLLLEALGDLRSQTGSDKEALAAFCRALSSSTGSNARSEIVRKIKRLHFKPSDCSNNLSLRLLQPPATSIDAATAR